MLIGPRPVWTLRLMLGASAAFAASLPAQEPAPSSIDRSLVPYASSKDAVRLPDGRKLQMVCMGQGSPTVILTAGNTRWSVDWNKVQAPVAAHTRVCAWDRAGIGLSDPPPRPQTVDETSADVAQAVEIAGITGPYILVGHSLGGYESLMLADRQPSSVVGMVLVDPSILDQAARYERVAPDLIKDAKEPSPLVQLLKKCSAALRSRTLKKGDPDPDGCMRPPPPPAHYPPELAAVMPSPDRANEQGMASAMEAMAFWASWELIERNSQVVARPDRNYGSMPLVVLTADGNPAPPQLSLEQRAQMASIDAETAAGHKEYAALSTRGAQRAVAGSTHDIHQTHPEAVIGAILDVLQQARASS